MLKEQFDDIVQMDKDATSTYKPNIPGFIKNNDLKLKAADFNHYKDVHLTKKK